MTTEEKAKAYDNALKRIREFYLEYDNISNLIDVKRELESIFPQLCESEDEQTRRRLIEFISDIKEISESGRNSWAIRKEDAEMCNAFLSYLEKQKEPIPIPDKFSGLKSLMLQYLQSAANRKDDSEIESDTDLWGRKILDYVWKYDDRQKEQEPISFNVPFNPDDYEVIMQGNATSLKQKEQKPVVTHGETYRVDTLGTQQVIAGKMPQKSAEWSYDNRIQYDSVKSGIEAFASTYSFNIESKLFPQLTKEQQQLWREEIEQAVIAGGENGVELARDNRYKENRTIEWSEEDKSFYDSIMCEVVKEGMRPTPAQTNWLKTLPERFALSPKQEWSEEDEILRVRTINRLETLNFHGISGKEIRESIAWLKSLCPQPKAELTLLDENIIEAAVAFVEQNDQFNYWKGIDKHTVIKALRSLKPYWKPSEEQIEALKDVAYGTYQNGNGPALRSLYEQLQELGVKEEPEYYQHFDPDC